MDPYHPRTVMHRYNNRVSGAKRQCHRTLSKYMTEISQSNLQQVMSLAQMKVSFLPDPRMVDNFEDYAENSVVNVPLIFFSLTSEQSASG